jgi:hypothetical protein
MRSLSKVIACLCLSLMLWSALALAMHRHSSEQESHSCQVCVAAHSAAPATIPRVPRPQFRKVLTLKLRPVAAKQRLESFARYVRPPPSV